MHRIEVALKKELKDFAGDDVLGDIVDLGLAAPKSIRAIHFYILEGKFDNEDLNKIASNLLTDPIIEDYAINDYVLPLEENQGHRVWVFKKTGVMDPVENSLLKGLKDLGYGSGSVRTGTQFIFYGDISEDVAKNIALKAVANEVIEEVRVGDWKEPEQVEGHGYEFKLIEADMLGLNDEELAKMSIERQLYLSLDEMKEIQNYYKKLGRKPTDIELESLAQTWSEHCCHKTLKARVTMDGKVVDNILKSTIAKVTKELDKDWCVSVFVDNAGIIKFDDDHNICFKVETHNHPSAIEPYGGAGTGIGGVIRDILGTGLGAKPILNIDVFCFGQPDTDRDELPSGTLHPKRVMKGVVRGVRDYGNRMGIPTANGSVYFDDRYVGNPLVYCGTVGLIPKESCEKVTHPGDIIVVAGGRTGRDGIHGATFSSSELTHESETISGGAVQIGNPIEEKKVTDVLLQARDRKLYRCVTDCGAGGLSSAVGEMGAEIGAEVHLENAPLKYDGLRYDEIWISEAQERMVFAVPPEKVDELLELFASEDVEAVKIGTFTDDKKLKIFYKGQQVADIDMDFLHDGVPRVDNVAHWEKPEYEEPAFNGIGNLGEDLKKILSSWNVCSKEWIIRQYDHEVQGGSVLKPLQGKATDGPGDACIVVPKLGSTRGVIVSNGMNPRFGDLDPYQMAAAGIDEALRNIIAVGGNLDQVAILDNFSWGNCARPENLGALVMACEACYDVAKVYGTPFISGKDSLNNEYNTGKKTITIPHTLLISAVAVMEDVTKAVSMDIKKPGNFIYVVGDTKRELGGSHFYMIRDFVGNEVPVINPEQGKNIFDSLSKATGSRLVKSCHDLSEGGLAVALAEMAFAGAWGIKAELSKVPCSKDVSKNWQVLFSESMSRFVVEVEPEKAEEFEAIMKDVPCAKIGEVTEEKSLVIMGLDDFPVIDEDIYELKDAWQAPLKW